MKLTAQIKLRPTAEQAEALRKTMQQVNAACNYASQRAWEAKALRQYDLHKMVYYDLRQKFGLSAQMAVRAIAKVADAYKVHKGEQRKFKPFGGIGYDDRILRFVLPKQEVSILTLDGRIKLPFVCGERQLRLLQTQSGETDLVLVKGSFYLLAACEVETPEPFDVTGYLGVDRGIKNVAATSDGKLYGGEALLKRRGQLLESRRTLQKARAKRRQRGASTRSVRRRQKSIGRREHNLSQTVNHTVAKQIVETAKTQRCGLALEQLRGIMQRVTVRHQQRYALHSWAFDDLQGKIGYKAALAGIPVAFVPSAYTSQECPSCGYTASHNRISQSEFRCRQCGYANHADIVGALNIQHRAVVNQPNARGSHGQVPVTVDGQAVCFS